MSLPSDASLTGSPARPDRSPRQTADSRMVGPFARALRFLLSHYLPLTAVCWLLVAFSAGMLVVVGDSNFGWDLHVYSNAIHSLQLGHDPYADGTAVQRVVHAAGMTDRPGVAPPYTYVYSPLTLPLLRASMHLPGMTGFILYWMMYAAGVGAIAWAGLRAAEPRERAVFTLLASASPFFPGMLQNDVILSGNLVYVLYGGVLCAAVLGWRRGIWWPFYVAVLAASCFKAPLLTLVAIGPLTARRQWWGAGLTSAAGLVIFGVQPLLWPSLFRSYLDAVELQFSFNHDFGLSPAGLLGDTLYGYHLPYATAAAIFYCFYGAAILGTLAYLARLYFDGKFPLERWIPVMLIGVILLNPRVKEYDIAPLTIPMCLVTWRLLTYRNWVGRALFEAFLIGFAINSFASLGDHWKPMEGTLLVLLFAGGAWQLIRGQAPALTPFLVQTNTRTAY